MVSSDFGSLKCGPRRAKFILESVADLRSQLEAQGSGLVVTKGKPEHVFSTMNFIAKDNVSTRGV